MFLLEELRLELLIYAPAIARKHLFCITSILSTVLLLTSFVPVGECHTVDP